jgi:hypothetical protein
MDNRESAMSDLSGHRIGVDVSGLLENVRYPEWDFDDGFGKRNGQRWCVGDIDGDGSGDFAVRRLGYCAGPGHVDVEVVSGGKGIALTGTGFSAIGSMPGRAVGIGRVDGDDVDDWAIALAGFGGEGRLAIVSGASGVELGMHQLTPGRWDAPTLVVALDDCDGDGVREVVVSVGDELMAVSGLRPLW